MKNDDEWTLVREILTKQEHVMITWKLDVKYHEFEN